MQYQITKKKKKNPFVILNAFLSIFQLDKTSMTFALRAKSSFTLASISSYENRKSSKLIVQLAPLRNFCNISLLDSQGYVYTSILLYPKPLSLVSSVFKLLFPVI